MHKLPEGISNKQTVISKKSTSETNDTLHHLAFENSSQPNIISVVSTGIIVTANIAACNLLGYSKQELLTKSRAAIFEINKSSFKKMFKQRMREGQSAALVTAVKKDGQIFPCEITSAVFVDNGIEKAITTITDMSKSILKQKNIDTKKEKIVADNIILAQAKSDVRLVENNEWIKCIAKTSYDVMWDWDIATGEIYVGDSIVELFGYKVQNNAVNIKDLRRCLRREEKEIVEKKLLETLASNSKSWKDSFTFKRSDSTIAFTTSRASIIRDENGIAVRMIGALQDVSRLQELESKLEEQMAVLDRYPIIGELINTEQGMGNRPAATGSIDDKKTILVKKIKSIVVQLVHYSNEQLQTNFSDYLSKELQYDYTYLANLFSQEEGIPIQKFIIAQKIERVKELIIEEKLNLTQIAVKLHYSSVAHLSNQFKKVTGFSPSYFKERESKQDKTMQIAGI
ncbi:MAG: domain S-box protein [Segetibacter sp.]|nr:domain S-box protein [Segetibacter sp.]